MAGQFLITQTENNTSKTVTAAVQATHTFDLPRSNFLSAIMFRIRFVTATATSTLDRVRIIANGSAILYDMTGGELRMLLKYETGQSTLPPGGAQHTFGAWMLQFGRFRRDTEVILPAKIYKSLQIQFSVTPGTAATSCEYDIASEEYISDDSPKSKLVRRIVTLQNETYTATGTKRVKITLGNRLRAIYLRTGDLRLLGGASATNPTGTNLIRVLVNNGAEVPWSRTLQQTVDDILATYRFDDGTIPGGEAVGIGTNDVAGGTGGAAATDPQRLIKLDFDVHENLEKVLDTSRMNELQVEFNVASLAGTDDTVTVLVEELVSVG